MLTEFQILEIIKKRIQVDEKLGYQSRGSEHLAYKSYSIDSYTVNQISSELFEINYTYKISIESEFTYLPDNPPEEFINENTVIVNSFGEIIEDYNPGDRDEAWENIKIKIEQFLEKVLLKIEWHYGEGRAPFVFPPVFKKTRNKNGEYNYRCTIKSDFPESNTFVYESKEVSVLLKNVIDDIDNRFAH